MSKTIENFTKFAFSVLMTACIMALAGCASTPVKHEAVFFPPAPEEPHLQYLKEISGSKDVEAPETGLTHSLLKFATGENDSNKPIVKPYGLQYANGKLYICDLQGYSIDIIDFSKNYYETFTGKGTGQLKKPLNVAVDKDDSMYVVDAGRHEVLHYYPGGDYAGTIDLPESAAGTGKAKFKPVDVAVDKENIYVLDMNGNDIKVFDKKTGKHLRNLSGVVDGQSKLSMPGNMALDDKGFIYVTNIASGSVVILDSKTCKVVGQFGKIGDGFGDFARPKGIVVGAEGRIWVADGGLQNVQLFQGDGKHRLLISIGDPGLPEGSLNLPAGIALTTDQLEYWQQFAAPGFILDEVAFVANQAGPVKISIYGLGHRAMGKEPSGKKK